MEKIKKAYSWLSDKLWPLTGSLSEEIIILAIAALFSSPTGYGVVVNWICIWSFIAIIRIAMYGEAVQDNFE
jgi:hypothetical protein